MTGLGDALAMARTNTAGLEAMNRAGTAGGLSQQDYERFIRSVTDQNQGFNVIQKS
jgi:hypothetical protein